MASKTSLASLMATKLCVKHVWTGACWEAAAPQGVARCELCPPAESHTVYPWKSPILVSWQKQNREQNKIKEKKKSELDLFDTFDALQRFSSHNCTCEKQTIATEVELALAKLKYKAWETCGSNSRAFWYLSTEAQKIIWIKWIKIISAQTWEICCHVS